MRLGKKFGLLLISSFAFVLLFAQNDKRTVGQEIYFDIKDTYKFHDTIIAFLNTPMNIGLKKGMLVKGYQSYKAAVPGTSKEKIFHEVGSGKMVWVDTLYSSGDTLTACFIKLSQPEDSMETGDVVSLNLEIPALPYRSVFSELVFQDIPVLNADRKAVFRYKDFIASDSRKKEDSVYAAIIDDFHNAWTQLKDRNDLSKTYLEKASAGRFEGKSILDVLRDVKRKDLESFLLYLKAYVSSYRGSSYPFYESFAGWLSVNSPYSSIEIKQALLPVYKK